MLSNISTIFLIILVLIQIVILKLLPIYSSKIVNSTRLFQLKHKLTSRYYLSQLYDYEFLDYCKYFLENMGFKNFEFDSNLKNKGITFKCSSITGEEFYIVTHQAFLMDDRGENVSDLYSKIKRSSIQQLLGSMIHDEIKNGMIITNGDYSEEAIEFAKSLPEDYYIKVIDGINLSKYSWNVYYRNLASIERSISR